MVHLFIKSIANLIRVAFIQILNIICYVVLLYESDNYLNAATLVKYDFELIRQGFEHNKLTTSIKPHEEWHTLHNRLSVSQLDNLHIYGLTAN